jgi:hypothetical protein
MLTRGEEEDWNGLANLDPGLPFLVFRFTLIIWKKGLVPCKYLAYCVHSGS